MNQPGRQSKFFAGSLYRPVAILLMLSGLIAFLVARLWFAEQMLCLVGSTLLTFAGLGVIVASRRYGGRSGRHSLEQSPMEKNAPEEWLERIALQTAPPAAPPVQPPNLLVRVQAHFESLGGQVQVVADRPGRSMIQVRGQNAHTATAILLETPAPADVADVRGLLAMVSEQNSRIGYLVAAGGFTDRAVQWARGRPVQLLRSDQLEQIRL